MYVLTYIIVVNNLRDTNRSILEGNVATVPVGNGGIQTKQSFPIKHPKAKSVMKNKDQTNPEMKTTISNLVGASLPILNSMCSRAISAGITISNQLLQLKPVKTLIVKNTSIKKSNPLAHRISILAIAAFCLFVASFLIIMYAFQQSTMMANVNGLATIVSMVITFFFLSRFSS